MLYVFLRQTFLLGVFVSPGCLAYLEAFSEIPENLWVKGVVKDLHDYGAFVMVQAPQTKEDAWAGRADVASVG